MCMSYCLLRSGVEWVQTVFLGHNEDDLGHNEDYDLGQNEDYDL
jgi:hypothetical protein